jgi:hypothetical protein
VPDSQRHGITRIPEQVEERLQIGSRVTNNGDGVVAQLGTQRQGRAPGGFDLRRGNEMKPALAIIVLPADANKLVVVCIFVAGDPGRDGRAKLMSHVQIESL